MEFLINLDAELLKTELLVFLEEEGYDDFVEEFVDYVKEDLSRGDCEVDN